MKKSLIAFGAALACLGTAQAQSNVQLSGLVDMYAGSVKMAGAERTSQLGSGGLTTSWWGMSGTEDLGNGLKVGFALGAFFRADTGTPGRTNVDNFFARDANVSLSGGFGTLKLGRSMAPNFLPTIAFNPFGDSFTVSPLVLHANMSFAPAANSTAVDTGWSNQITYSTPNLNGFQANLHYAFGEQAGDSGANNIGANLTYRSGALALTAFYEQADILGTPSTPLYVEGSKNENWMLGGSYDFGAAKLYATYGESEKEVASAQTLDQKTYSLGLDVPVTKAGTLKLAAAQSDRDYSVLMDNKRTTVTLGYDHFLSKRTDVYTAVMYDKLSFDGASNQSGTSAVIGLRHRF
ncbi:MAG: porin [Comamonadaceae bacterium]|nr:porin [Comamonadaceae bacterium]